MTCTGMSTYDAMQIITAFLSNVGIGFGGFGPTDAFGSMSDGAKCSHGRHVIRSFGIIYNSCYASSSILGRVFYKKQSAKRYRIL